MVKNKRFGKKRLTIDKMRLKEFKDLTKKEKAKLKEEYEFAKMDFDEDKEKDLKNLKEEYYEDLREDKKLKNKLR